MKRTVDEVSRMAEAGGGLTMNAPDYSVDELALIAVAARTQSWVCAQAWMGEGTSLSRHGRNLQRTPWLINSRPDRKNQASNVKWGLR